MNKETITFGLREVNKAIPKVVTKLVMAFYVIAGNGAAIVGAMTYFHYLTPELGEKILGAVACVTPLVATVSHLFGVKVPENKSGEQRAGADSESGNNSVNQ